MRRKYEIIIQRDYPYRSSLATLNIAADNEDDAEEAALLLFPHLKNTEGYSYYVLEAPDQ